MGKNKDLKDNEKKVSDRKKLLSQILKFAVVGGLSCVIDFAIYSILYYGVLIRIMSDMWAAAIASIAGFMISLIFNYIASMAFVFQRKEDANKVTEFIIFGVLSLIGLALNTLIILGVMWLYKALVVGQDNFFANIWNFINDLCDKIVAFMFGIINKEYEPIDWVPIEAKVVATAIVMVYNFITRKIFIEKKD